MLDVLLSDPSAPPPLGTDMSFASWLRCVIYLHTSIYLPHSVRGLRPQAFCTQELSFFKLVSTVHLRCLYIIPLPSCVGQCGSLGPFSYPPLPALPRSLIRSMCTSALANMSGHASATHLVAQVTALVTSVAAQFRVSVSQPMYHNVRLLFIGRGDPRCVWTEDGNAGGKHNNELEWVAHMSG